MSTQIVIRIEPELKKKVDKLARMEGKTTSTVVRDLLEEYTRDRDIEGYIDSLWTRIGKKFTAKGITEKDIGKTIAESRKSG
jgi:predicted transcriptional regulator